MYKFNERLKQLRLNSEMTQQQVAKKLNVVESCYAHWEQGRTEPNITMLDKLANIFEISADYMLGRENEEGNIITVAPDLSDEEQRLIDYYRALPIDLRAAVVSYAQTFFELDSKAKRKI